MVDRGPRRCQPAEPQPQVLAAFFPDPDPQRDKKGGVDQPVREAVQAHAEIGLEALKPRDLAVAVVEDVAQDEQRGPAQRPHAAALHVAPGAPEPGDQGGRRNLIRRHRQPDERRSEAVGKVTDQRKRSLRRRRRREGTPCESCGHLRRALPFLPTTPARTRSRPPDKAPKGERHGASLNRHWHDRISPLPSANPRSRLRPGRGRRGAEPVALVHPAGLYPGRGLIPLTRLVSLEQCGQGPFRPRPVIGARMARPVDCRTCSWAQRCPGVNALKDRRLPARDRRAHPVYRPHRAYGGFAEGRRLWSHRKAPNRP